MNTPAQDWNVEDYRIFADFVPRLGEPLLALLDAKPGEKILDVGCGEGSLTRKIMRSGADVTGIDADSAMVEAAKKAGVNAFCMDASRLSFDAEFDAVFSNAALHWVKPPQDVAAGIYRALKPGGRFIAEMGGTGNTESSRSAFHHQLAKRGINPAPYDPWYFPAPEEYTKLLEAQGFILRQMELFARPTPIGTDATGWLTTFGGSFLKALPESEWVHMLSDVATEVKAQLPRDKDGIYLMDYVRLRFVAMKAS